MKTRITIPVLVELDDPRSCRGCQFIRYRYPGAHACAAFPSRQGPRRIPKQVKVGDFYQPRRLDQCVEQGKVSR